jgi:hypothetical protein
MFLWTLKEINLRLALDLISGIETLLKKCIHDRHHLELQGVAKKGLSSYIKELIWDHKADFVGIQETMKKS